MYEKLINQIIDKTKQDFADFPSSLEGEIYLSGDAVKGWETTPNLTLLQKEELAKELNNKPIYAQLEVLDLKSVRPLREGNAVKVAELEAEAELLRTQLI